MSSAAEIFAAGDIADLPFIQLDPNYFAFDWRRKLAHKSMIFRLAASLLPRYPVEDETFSHKVTEMGARIIREFDAHARREGITPLVVYLPSRSDFANASMILKDRTIARARDLGVEVVDLTGCLTEKVDYEDLFVADGVHYSGRGNHAFAHCLIESTPELVAAD